MNEIFNGSTEFTNIALNAMYETVDSQSFRDQDANLIYETLKNKLRFISFGDYLKRYIYKNAGFSTSFEDVPLKCYQQVIRDSFSDNDTPKSFTPTSTRLSALSKNWLTQQTVKRSVVFLLGFGLSMSVEDVNDFLTKALRERGINPKDPFEVICWYCYKMGYGYLKFEKLWQTFCEMPGHPCTGERIFGDMTVGARDAMYSIEDDSSLLMFVSGLKAPDNRSCLSLTLRKSFDELYLEAREVTAGIYNRAGTRQNRKNRKEVYTAEDITENDLERIISSAIPVDGNGNLLPGRASALNAQFAGKRFSRQHISDILAGRSEVTRFDLITLIFFTYSQKVDEIPDAKKRLMAFVERTNAVLEQCSMGQLYVTNPYECFVLMCMLTESPLGTYADVWEKAYAETLELC